MSEKLNKKFSYYSLEWIKDSTSHGFPKIFKTERILLKVLWVICTLASACGCAYFIVRAVADYSNYDVVTSIRVTPEIPIKFPAIDICNYNPFLTNESDLFLENLFEENSISNVINSSFVKSDYQIFRNIDLARYFAKVNLENPALNKSYKKSFGFELNNFMLSCNFAGVDCKNDNFVWYFNKDYGNCYKFNSGKNSNGNKVDVLSQNSFGVFGGFRMELLNKFNKASKQNYYASKGFVVLIYDQGDSADNFKPIYISTKTQTFLTISKLVNIKKENPYSNCTSDHSDSQESDIYKAAINANVKYTQNVCIMACFQNYLISKCSCWNTNLPYLREVPGCITMMQIFCNYQAYDEFFNKQNVYDNCSSSCPLECEKTVFDYKASFLEYPSDDYLKFLVEMIKERNISIDMSLNEVRDNVLALNIYYDNLETTTIIESEKTSLPDLISNLGGLLGLFLGVSFLSFAEIFEIMIELILITYEHKKKKINTVNTMFFVKS